MTENRFSYVDYNDTVKDNETGKEYHTWYEDNLCDLLNQLNDENENLRKEINQIKKDGILAWINKNAKYHYYKDNKRVTDVLKHKPVNCADKVEEK